MTNLNAAIETAKAKVAGNAAWTRSIEKAASALINGKLIVTVFTDNSGVVTSDNGSYHIQHGFCSCPARTNHCYHIAALRICNLADEMPEPTATREELVAEIKTTFAAKFPGYSLTATVNRLCGPYTVEMLGVANLRHVLSAIA